MNLTYQEDRIELDVNKITAGTDAVHGKTTTFHDVVIASEMVQPYNDGMALKDRDELEAYTPYVEGGWITLGSHPDTSIISDRTQVHGRTHNVRFTKSLNDETKRPKRAGVVVDMTIFDEKAPPDLLEGMKNGIKRDVSIGFFFHKDETPGEFKGVAFDYVQRNMFHNHVAAAIDEGRCPSPFCGLGADEIREMIGDPFSGFANFAECQRKIAAKNPELSAERVDKICGSLKAKSEDRIVEEDLVKYASKILRAVMDLSDEVEGLKGERDALKEEQNTPWWEPINWKDDEYTTIFDHLSEETRQLITDAGQCPSCDEEEGGNTNGPIKCPSGEEWSEEHEKCVPIAEEENEDVRLTKPPHAEEHKEPKSRRRKTKPKVDESLEELLLRGDKAISNVKME